MIRIRIRRQPALSGWWLVLDRADTVLSVVVLILAIFMLVRDQPSRWWALVMVVLVLGGTGFRQLVERRRQLLVAGLDA